MKVEECVYKHYAALNETDLQIWAFIKSNQAKVFKATINELADLTNVSRTTISRFVRKIGFSGFSEFRVMLNLDASSEKVLDQRAFDDACSLMIQYIEELQRKDYSEICQLIHDADRLFIYGSGDVQNAVAKQLKRMFLSCNELVYDVGGVTFDCSLFDLLQAGDTMILLSLGGTNPQVLDIARHLKIKGVTIISVTEFKNNPLADMSDESLYISSAKLNFIDRFPDYKLTMLYYILVELLFIKYSIFKSQENSI
ncbi:RpiR family glv operon transcriptional regulator [Streptococcus varani]|uniref:RpiR family glv operon transcriptional regulator n=1 Tax=Streptococcus varani TaxID=1608583 RepID=A0A0E4H2J4_9STRE|nr:MurR/RpiR family transcriptional regulator [Streptococcus varani]CQR23720.1 RpiR family glv operon transcriptional regulator [Streptococcus varani]